MTTVVPGVSHGGPATKPSKKKPWVAPADWKQKTQARWAANHPQPLFPSVAVTGKERASTLADARQQVTQTYAATPMPTQASYLQPFADAHARVSAAGQNYVNYLDSAAANAQNISGAFNQALTGGITAGQQAVTAQGGGIPAAPTAAASLIPAAGVGSSFTNYLNAEKPYVGAAVNESQRQIDAGSMKAAGDYQAAAAERRGQIQDAIQKVFASNLDSLQGSKVDANKAAVTEYLALGKTAYQKAQNADRTRRTTETINHNTATEAAASAKLANTKAYQQKTLDAKRTSAAAKGIDLAPAYKQLFVTTPGKAATGAKTGPQGQTGGVYTVIESKVDSFGDSAGDTTVEQLIPYGKPVPKARSWTNPDGSKVTRKVVLKKQVFPSSKSTGAATRKATPASWDRAVALLRNKYPGQITQTWLKANFPPRPAGT